jgi:hypothetical protein
VEVTNRRHPTFKPAFIAVRSIPANAPAPVNEWCIWLERLFAATLKIKKIAGKSRVNELF